ALVQALLKEIGMQKDYLDSDAIESIYFGGGTPSLLDESDLKSIFDSIHRFYHVKENVEITFEANPDDLNKNYLQMLSKTEINRLSIGIQSFHDNELHYLNRLHTGDEAKVAVESAQEVGLSSISIDLIYGIPIATNESWQQNLEQFQRLHLEHLSAYNLTREENTAYDLLIKKGKYAAPDDLQGETHFKQLLAFAKANQLEQYEISNFAFDQKYAKHNTNYWYQKKYLGLGPSAHSFNLLSRSWNVSNLKNYIDSIAHHQIPNEAELLSKADRWNEQIMTGLRTKWGVSTKELSKYFEEYWIKEFEEKALSYIKNGQLLKSNDRYVLTEKGLFFADGIAADFFRIEFL
ncbi:MAG: radical SAM family heme chaperone HemW, partial [Bacteroidales bacterium]|nr:radical SAM family heme chaperone HemW [Bacteroidales bacterium]